MTRQRDYANTEDRKGVRFAGVGRAWWFGGLWLVCIAITAYLNSLDMNYTNGSNIYVSSRSDPTGP